MNRSVRFPDELVPRIQAEADRLERSFNWVVVRTLEKALSAKTTAAVERERDAVTALSASPVPVTEYTRMQRDLAEEADERAGVPMFRCRHNDFRAASPKARCPNHGGTLIPE